MKYIKTLAILAFFLTMQLLRPSLAFAIEECGRSFPASEAQTNTCTCTSGKRNFTDAAGRPMSCCGWVLSRKEDGEFVQYCSDSPNSSDGSVGIDITGSLTKEDINALNPLYITGSSQAETLSTPGGIVSRMLSFVFPIAGLILFAMISWGGFEILTNASGQKGMEAGKNRITAAIVGFILLFSSYWMAQIVEAVFGIKIL